MTRLARTSCLILLALSASAHAQDSVELFSGQDFHGNLTDTTITIRCGLGTIPLPLDRVSSLLCQPPPRAQQSLAMRDGDVLVGRVQAASVHLTADDGTAMDLPLSQISRIDIAARADSAPATMPANTTVVFDLDGDKLQVQPPASIEFRTRWGLLNLLPTQVRQIVLAEKNQPAHRLVLSDGSSLSGILTAQTLTLQPADSPQPLDAPVGEIARLVLAVDPPRDHNSPRLDMIGGDVLRGALQGTFTLETEFGPATIAAGKIRRIAPVIESAGDVTVTLTDGRTLRGTAEEATADCGLECGITVQVPAGMITAYDKSAPPYDSDADQPTGSSPMTDTAVQQRVQQMIRQLESQTLAPGQRIRLQNQIVALGNPAIAPLNQFRPGEPPRIQRQIDAMLARIQANAQGQ
jgi:hypothetical protein